MFMTITVYNMFMTITDLTVYMYVSTVYRVPRRVRGPPLGRRSISRPPPRRCLACPCPPRDSRLRMAGIVLAASVLTTLQLVPAGRGGAPCAIKDFSSHHCHLDMSNLSSSKVTTPEECSAAVCAAGGGLDTSQWCAAGAGCNPVGCYGATISKQASCPRTHGWKTSLINFQPPPPPAPGMTSRTVPQSTADKHGAKCLNGAAPKVEIRLNKSSTQWVLFLEGGGWCYGATDKATVASCARRGGFVPGVVGDPTAASGARVNMSTSDYGGVMGSSPETNPDFYTWNAIFIHYCDGASMGSSRTDPIAVKDKKGKPTQMWMRGRNNFNAAIDDLLSTQGMNKATEVILSGGDPCPPHVTHSAEMCPRSVSEPAWGDLAEVLGIVLRLGSAGGLAVFYNLDHLVTLLPSSVRVVGFPDAGCELCPLACVLPRRLVHPLAQALHCLRRPRRRLCRAARHLTGTLHSLYGRSELRR
jgi:hypothetical protein